MKTRESIRKYIVSHGAKTSRFRSWEQSAESEGKGLLHEHLPSGYSSWFAIVEGKSIWWAYSDSSDGGVWTSEGVAITGYWISYEEDLARAIYDMCYPRVLNNYERK